MVKKGRMLINIMFLGLSSAISKLAVFWMLPLYTSYLTPAAFGVLDILINTAVLLLPLVSMGAPEAVFRFAAGGESERETVSVGRRMLGVGFSFLLLIMPFLSLVDLLRPYILHLLFYILFAVLRSYFSHILRARGRYGLYAVQQVFCTLATVLLAYLFIAVWKWDIGGYLLATLSADGITALILLFYLRLRREEGGTHSPRLFRTMLRYAVPLIPTATLWWALAVSDRYILLFFYGKEITGLYAAAGKLPALLTFAANIFLEAWHFAVIREREEKRGALFEKIYGALLPVLVLFVLVLTLLSRWVVGRVFAPEFEKAALFVPFLAIAALFSALSSFLGSVYVVKLRSGASLGTALAGALVNLGLDALWIPRFGVAGAMAATLLSYITVFVWRSLHCKRVMRFRQHGRELSLSTLFLLLTAVMSAQGKFLPSLAFALLSLLPFWREIGDSVKILVIYCVKIFQISTKREKRY